MHAYLHTYVIHTYTDTRDLVQDLAHMIMEAEKFHHLPFASWTTWKTYDIIQSESKVPEHQSQKTGDDGCPSLSEWSLRIHSSCIFLFSPGPPQIRWWQSLMRTHIGEDNILYSVYQFKCRSLPKTPSQTHSSITFCQLSQHLWIQTSWHIKLTITFCNCFGGWEREVVGNLYWKFLHQVETWTGNSHIPF